jgi:hypothetical protein
MSNSAEAQGWVNSVPARWRKPVTTSAAWVAVLAYILLAAVVWKAALELSPPNLAQLGGSSLAGGFVGVLINPSTKLFTVVWAALSAATLVSVLILGVIALFSTATHPAAMPALGVLAAGLVGLLTDADKFTFRELTHPN